MYLPGNYTMVALCVLRTMKYVCTFRFWIVIIGRVKYECANVTHNKQMDYWEIENDGLVFVCSGNAYGT